MRKGSPRQVAKAIVSPSPTIAVPSHREQSYRGCARRISAARSSWQPRGQSGAENFHRGPIDVDVMLAMAAKIHVATAPSVTK
jgi:hypothetical protein